MPESFQSQHDGWPRRGSRQPRRSVDRKALMACVRGRFHAVRFERSLARPTKRCKRDIRAVVIESISVPEIEKLGL
jgi:hypothetical protein